MEKVVTWLLFIFFRVRVPDANVPFRLMESSTLKRFLYRIPKDYFLPNIILTAYFKRFGCVVAYKRISFNGRSAGTNSISMLKIVKVGIRALKDFAMFAKDMSS